MVVDAVRTYFDAASGLTELTRKRAVAAAKTLLKAGDDRPPSVRADGGARPVADEVDTPRSARVGHDIQSLAADLIETNQANRAALNALVEAEVSRVLDRLDLVRRDDYERVVRRVAELERRLASQRFPSVARIVPAAGAPSGSESAERSEPVGKPGEGSEEKRPENAVRETGGEAEPTRGSDDGDRGVPDGTPTGGRTAAESSATSGEAGSGAGEESEPKGSGRTTGVSDGQGTAEETDAGEAGPEGARLDQATGGPRQQTPGARQRSGQGGKQTKAAGKQTASNTAGKSGKSKSTTKRSGGSAKSTAQAKKNEQ